MFENYNYNFVVNKLFSKYNFNLLFIITLKVCFSMHNFVLYNYFFLFLLKLYLINMIFVFLRKPCLFFYFNFYAFLLKSLTI